MFSPVDRTTYGPPLADRGALWAVRGPGLPTFAACGIVALCSALAGSTPLLDPLWAMFAVSIGVMIAFSCAARLLVVTFGILRYPECRAIAWRGRWRWAVILLAGLTCLGLLVGKPVWRVRWLVSRSAFDAVAADARSGKSLQPETLVGVIRVHGTRAQDGDVHVPFDGGGFFDRTTLVQSMAGEPTTSRGTPLPVDLGGHWYLVVKRFGD